MSKNYFIYYLFILFVLPAFTSGCDMNEKQSLFSNDVDTLLAFNAKLDSTIKADSVKYEQEIARIRREAEARVDSIKASYADGAVNISKPSEPYHVVVGSFKFPKNAARFQQRISEMGYTSHIFEAENDFYLVTAASYGSLSATKRGLRTIRGTVSTSAWIYITR